MTEISAVAVDRARLRLLSGWQLLVEGVPIQLGHREQRLLALLSLGEGGARAQVASGLWPDSTDERALASLRRAVLQCQKRVPGLLDARRTTIALVPEVAVDVDDLRRAAGLTQLPMSDEVARELLVALRGEEFLPGWYDDWVAAERERLAQLRVEAFDRIARHGLDAGDLLLALDAARSASDIEPLLEWPREVAIRAHVGRGDLAGALHEYQRYCGLLQDELGVAPSSRIVGLLEPHADPGARAPAPVELPRPRLALPVESLPLESLPPAPPPAPPPGSNGPVSLDSFLDGDGPPSGTRSAILALVGAAGLAVAASLAVALSGPDRAGEPTTDPQAGVSVSVPAGSSTPLASDPARPSTRQVDVRAVDSAGGSAAFTIRATQRPAEVTLVVRGRAGMRVVRHLVVRGAGGRQVVLDGLDPGTYQWSASSPSASQVYGVVSVETTGESPDSEESASATTTVPAVTPVVATTSPAATVTATPTSTPTATTSASPHPSPSTSPTGRPSDPGSVPPTPVG